MKTKSIGTPNLLKYLYMNIDKIITTELKNKILFKQLYPLKIIMFLLYHRKSFIYSKKKLVTNH